MRLMMCVLCFLDAREREEKKNKIICVRLLNCK